MAQAVGPRQSLKSPLELEALVPSHRKSETNAPQCSLRLAILELKRNLQHSFQIYNCFQIYNKPYNKAL
ncbi:hypothetical protein BN873_260043 [Candidatus Competibacter denitrificans Run_A_D11]|uniref:Uncharacterized protein n=1 Tax=Candidatus Competibacter denitrificans Run_A_D11 TaxID=1400863 RepID=W6M3J0_9GAMM|nr:hypothetical protein BN873_260043 [Candidatus Competibacter denitrificans Run_A_D11]